MYCPFGVKVTMSGREPTSIDFNNMQSPQVVKISSFPGSCLFSFSTATARRPLQTAILFALFPYDSSAIEKSDVGLEGFLIFVTSTEPVCPLTENNLFVNGS